MTPTHAQLAERCAEVLASTHCENNWRNLSTMAQCIRELLEALREAETDAGRYRWLRDEWHGFQYYKATIGGVNFASLDRDIDAALNRKAKT